MLNQALSCSKSFHMWWPVSVVVPYWQATPSCCCSQHFTEDLSLQYSLPVLSPNTYRVLHHLSVQCISWQGMMFMFVLLCYTSVMTYHVSIHWQCSHPKRTGHSCSCCYAALRWWPITSVYSGSVLTQNLQGAGHSCLCCYAALQWWPITSVYSGSVLTQNLWGAGHSGFCYYAAFQWWPITSGSAQYLQGALPFQCTVQ